MIKNEDDIFTKNNPYGYRLNVNHPLIRRYYERYKVHVGATILSDKQRFEFEAIMIKAFNKRNK